MESKELERIVNQILVELKAINTSIKNSSRNPLFDKMHDDTTAELTKAVKELTDKIDKMKP
jgi:hypothetical protein